MPNYTVFDWTFDAQFADNTPNTQETDPVDAIHSLLSDAADFWGYYTTTEQPTVLRWHDRAEGERGPGHDQPPELYVWQPTGGPIERFSADGALLWEPNQPVEVWAFSLDESEVKTLTNDVIDIIDAYLDNQQQDTEHVDIQPTSVEDFREQKPQRVTEHYVYRVTVDLERFRDVA